MRIKIGEFYERLTEGIFGGSRNPTRNHFYNSETLFCPDVVSNNFLIESKSVCYRNALKLTDTQTYHYLLQQCENFYTHSPLEIFFSIFSYNIKHPLRDLKKSEDPLEGLVQMLSQNTSFMLFLPFSVISYLHEPKNKFPKKTRGGFSDRTDIPKYYLEKILISPKSAFKEIGIQGDNYLFFETRLSNNVHMNDCEVTSFPILIVQDKDYDSWLKKFKEEKKSKVEEILTEYKKDPENLFPNNFPSSDKGYPEF